MTKFFVIFILIYNVDASSDSFVCKKQRNLFSTEATYKIKKEQSCKTLCGLALEKAGPVCAKSGVDVKLSVIDDGIAACGGPVANNTFCNVSVQCNVCPR